MVLLACGRSDLVAPVEDVLPVEPAQAPPVVRRHSQLSGAGDTVCRLSPEGVLSCFGKNHDGTIGDGTASPRATAFVHPGRWRAVTAGPRDTCGVRDDGTLWCWGRHAGWKPTKVSPDSDWSETALGFSLPIALKTDGSLWVWQNTFVHPTRVSRIDGTWRSFSMGLFEGTCLETVDGHQRCSPSPLHSQRGAQVIDLGVTGPVAIWANEVFIVVEGKLQRGALPYSGAVTWRDEPVPFEVDRVLTGTRRCAHGLSGALFCWERDGVNGGFFPGVALSGRWDAFAPGDGLTCAQDAETDDTWCFDDLSLPPRRVE